MRLTTSFRFKPGQIPSNRVTLCRIVSGFRRDIHKKPVNFGRRFSHSVIREDSPELFPEECKGVRGWRLKQAIFSGSLIFSDPGRSAGVRIVRNGEPERSGETCPIQDSPRLDRYHSRCYCRGRRAQAEDSNANDDCHPAHQAFLAAVYSPFTGGLCTPPGLYATLRPEPSKAGRLPWTEKGFLG